MSGSVAVLAVADEAGVADRVSAILGNAGFRVGATREVAAEDVVHAARAADASAVVVVGDGGIAGSAALRLEHAFTRRIPGWAPVAYAAAFGALGSGAVRYRTAAGYIDGCPIVALPAEASFAILAVEQVLAHELGRWIQAGMELVMAGDDDVVEPPPAQLAPPAAASADDAAPQKPSGRFGSLGRTANSFSVSASQDESSSGPDTEGDEGDGPPAGGWKRAVWELGGTVHFDKREELPQPVEKLAPLHDVLHTAGETAVLALPNRVRFSIWGWPDLRRANSKVLAVGWGEPLCEVLALHRHPQQTGTCIQEARGRLPAQDADVAEVCKTVTGRAPSDTSGQLFALEGSTVWILRGSRVIRWDGSRERDDGNPKQVLASLVLQWSGR